MEDQSKVYQQDGGVLGKRPRPASTTEIGNEQAKRPKIDEDLDRAALEQQVVKDDHSDPQADQDD